MQNGGLFALDLSGQVGWAYAPLDYRPVLPLDAATSRVKPDGVLSGSHRVAPPNVTLGAFLDRFGLWLADMITVHQPSILVFEAPILSAGKTSIETARKLMCMAGLTELIAHRRQIPTVRECNVASVKKHWTGHGHARKPEMIAAARARGFDPRDDNEADAIALADYGVACLLSKTRAA